VPAESNVDALEVLLRDDDIGRRLALDVVIGIGSPPTSGALDGFLRRDGSHRSRALVADGGWPDPIGTAECILFGDLGRTVDALTSALSNDAPRPRRAPWLSAANRAAWRAVDRVIAESERLSEAAAVREAENMQFLPALKKITGREFATVDTLYSSEDQLEGARAFSEKRDPVWKGK
jgi:2-succinyl-5-enolpyruvyl-6-hydroxy-3-cyclohexene-1-carboxylate synthase